MGKRRLTAAAEVASVIVGGPNAVSLHLRPAVLLHLRCTEALLRETIEEHAVAGVSLSSDSPEVASLCRVREAIAVLEE